MHPYRCEFDLLERFFLLSAQDTRKVIGAGARDTFTAVNDPFTTEIVFVGCDGHFPLVNILW